MGTRNHSELNNSILEDLRPQDNLECRCEQTTLTQRFLILILHLYCGKENGGIPYTINKAKCSCAGQEELKAGNPGTAGSSKYSFRMESRFCLQEEGNCHKATGQTLNSLSMENLAI